MTRYTTRYTAELNLKFTNVMYSENPLFETPDTSGNKGYRLRSSKEYDVKCNCNTITSFTGS